MILVHFLYRGEQWDRFLPAVPQSGDRVTFNPMLPERLKVLGLESEFEVAVIHWYEDGSLVGDNPDYQKMTPYVTLRLIDSE